jgi:hypothetical protein
LQKLKTVKASKGTADDMVLIIKPGEGSAFKNFVDMADEVAINNIKHYFIDEMNEFFEEKFFIVTGKRFYAKGFLLRFSIEAKVADADTNDFSELGIHSSAL